MTDQPKIFRKKPVEIQAMQLLGSEDGDVEPDIGGLAQVDVSEWPGGVAHVWLEVDSYAHVNESATVVLHPNEAREVAAALTFAAHDVENRRAGNPDPQTLASLTDRTEAVTAAAPVDAGEANTASAGEEADQAVETLRGELKAKIATFVDRMLETEAWEESGAEAADRIMRMLDEAGWRPPLGMEPWRVDARIQEQRATSLGYCEHVDEVHGEPEECGELRERGTVFCTQHWPAPAVAETPAPADLGAANRRAERFKRRAELDQQLADLAVCGQITTGDVDAIQTFKTYFAETPAGIPAAFRSGDKGEVVRCFPDAASFIAWRARWWLYVLGEVDGPTTAEEYAEHLAARANTEETDQ